MLEKCCARSLINNLKEPQDKVIFEQGLASIAKMFESNLQVKKILLNPSLGNEEKLNFIKDVFPSHNDPKFLKVIEELLKNNLINNIGGIYKEYSRLNSILNNELSMNIISAQELNEDEINSLTDKFKKMYKADNVKFTVNVDKELLGGIKVIIGNKVYDGSLKTQLRRIL